MRAFVFAFLLAVSGLAAAQYYNSLSGRQFNNMYAANADRLMSQMIQQSGYQAMRNSIEASVRQKAAAGAVPQAPASNAPGLSRSAKHPITASDFRPAGPRRVPEQLAEHATNARDRADIVKAGRQIHAAIEATPGFRKNNVAAAMTVLLGVSVQVLKGVEFSDAESQSLMRGLNEELAAMESFRALSAEQRTQVYDAFVVTGGFIAGIAQAGAETGNGALQEQARAMARDALARFGVKA